MIASNFAVKARAQPKAKLRESCPRDCAARPVVSRAGVWQHRAKLRDSAAVMWDPRRRAQNAKVGAVSAPCR
jgi:hypothetical protein